MLPATRTLFPKHNIILLTKYGNTLCSTDTESSFRESFIRRKQCNRLRRLEQIYKRGKKNMESKTFSTIVVARNMNHSSDQKKKSLPYPKEIAEYLDKHVVGQHHAKRVLAVGVYQHYKRLINNLDIEEALHNSKASGSTKFGGRNFLVEGEDTRSPKDRFLDSIAEGVSDLDENDFSGMVLDKSNIILSGPSGSGKTHLTQRLARILNVPIALCDCTTLTQAGYVGDDVESVIVRLLENADGDIERAQQGIVFLDEIDKINSSTDPQHTSGNRDVSGRGVQQSLLKLVEGHTVKVKNPYNPLQKVDIDTSNILFVGSGAFNSLDRIVAQRLETRNLGFGSSMNQSLLESLDGHDESVLAKKRDEMIRQADQGDLIEFGLIPELVGRFPILVPFHSLDKSDLLQVLTVPAHSIIAQAQRFFAMDGITLKFTSCAIEAMAQEAVRRRTGARALKTILERTLLNAKFELPGTNTKTVIFDGTAIYGKGSYRAVNKDLIKRSA